MERYVWNGLIAAMLLVTLWFSIKSLYHLYEYLSLNSTVITTSSQWSVREISDERYLLQSDYNYQVKDIAYKGHTLFDSPTFRNRWAAEQVLPEYNDRQWEVWYSERNPEYSTLQKSFSIKEFVSAILLWGLLAYFVWLRYYYAAKFMGKKS